MKRKTKVAMFALSAFSLISCSMQVPNVSDSFDPTISSEENSFEGSIAAEIRKIDGGIESNFIANVYFNDKELGAMYSDGLGKLKAVVPPFEKKITDVLPAGTDTQGYVIADRLNDIGYRYGRNFGGNGVKEEDGYKVYQISLEKEAVTLEYAEEIMGEFLLGYGSINELKDEDISRINSTNVYQAKGSDDYGFDYTYRFTIEKNEIKQLETIMNRDNDEYRFKYIYQSIGKFIPITLDDYNNFQEANYVVKENLSTGEVTLE